MRLSQAFGKTLREAPADAEMASHRLLVRGNFIRPLAAGIYTFMPLGYRVIRKIGAIISQEMEAIGGQELSMPNLHPAGIWQATGRWDTFDVLLKLQGGGGRDYALSATHEEVVVDLCLREIDSYRDLPQFIYHIGKKFRDEQRARGGLVRLREFLMKDAYSLDTSEAALDAFYPRILQAYASIFARTGVPAILIEADSGAMGGTASHEFTVPHSQGEDVYIACGRCHYAANVEAATFTRQGEPPQNPAPLAKVATPDCRTIAAVADYLGVPTSQTLKAVFTWFTPAGKTEAEGRFIFALVRGDLDINQVKLANQLGGGTLRPATDQEIRASGAEPGYASAVGLAVAPDRHSPGVVLVADTSLTAGGDFVIGANQAGFHYTGANYPRDFPVTLLADIAQADSGHLCPRCGGVLEARRGIEVGHCFKLGTGYSAAANAVYLDEENRPQFIFMGSYGIGLDRLMAVIVEEHHDEQGIIWPDSVAPYGVHLLHLGKGEEVRQAADQLYQEMVAAGLEVLYDDRQASAGIKLNDADLIGIPYRVTIGSRSLAQGQAEVKRRDQEERRLVPLNELVAILKPGQAGRGPQPFPA